MLTRSPRAARSEGRSFQIGAPFRHGSPNQLVAQCVGCISDWASGLFLGQGHGGGCIGELPRTRASHFVSVPNGQLHVATMNANSIVVVAIACSLLGVLSMDPAPSSTTTGPILPPTTPGPPLPSTTPGLTSTSTTSGSAAPSSTTSGSAAPSSTPSLGSMSSPSTDKTPGRLVNNPSYRLMGLGAALGTIIALAIPRQREVRKFVTPPSRPSWLPGPAPSTRTVVRKVGANPVWRGLAGMGAGGGIALLADRLLENQPKFRGVHQQATQGVNVGLEKLTQGVNVGVEKFKDLGSRVGGTFKRCLHLNRASEASSATPRTSNGQ